MAKTHYPVDADEVMRELCRVDRHLARVIRKVGSFPTKKQKPQLPFESLLRAIVYQQLAGAAAATIFGRVKALGSDGNSDTAPSSTDGVDFPIHVLAINAMGVHLLDYLQFEDLRAICERTGRWEFLFVAAPLRIPGGTGSPVNPLAIF